MPSRNRLYQTISKQNYVYYSGKDHVGNIDFLLQEIDLHDKFLFIIDCFSFHDRDSDGNFLPFDVYPDIQQYQKSASENNLKFIVIFEMLPEAPSYRHNLKFHIDDISQNCNIPTNEMIIYSGAHHQFDEPIRFATDFSVFFGDYPLKDSAATILPTHHFVSLVRLIRTHRIAATVDILDRNLQKYGIISFGSGYQQLNPIELAMIPDRYKNTFPLYIDGFVPVNHAFQHYGTLDEMKTAFINIVHETSFDHDFHYNGFSHLTWSLPFYTEKTVKPFAWGQVPIFIALKDHDVFLREKGLDLFDDIIDQSYNQESDPHIRIKKAIDELEKICNWPIEKWAQYKQDNINRFIKNREIITKMTSGRTGLSIENLKKVLDTY